MYSLYECHKCKSFYPTEGERNQCEKVPVTHDNELKPGDKIEVIAGELKGKVMTVYCSGIADKYYASGSSEKYHHTVYVAVAEDNVDSIFKCNLLWWDQYKPIAGGLNA